MVGITSIGAYVPIYRLSRDEIGRTWEIRSLGGEKAVAKYDEDSLTMAVAAALDCMKQVKQVDGLFFATTTSPYEEKQAATIIAAAADLPRETRTADYTGSLRAATIAINSAIDSVQAGAAKNVLITAADCRMGQGKSEFEQLLGDGAAALTIGSSDPIATIEGRYSLFDELFDEWRPEGEAFTRSWEKRFMVSEGYINTMQELISKTIKKYELTLADFAKVVFYGPDQKSHASLAKRLGLDSKNQVQETLYDSIGNSGAAALPLMLNATFQQIQPGDKILLVSYAGGGDAFILKATQKIGKIQQKQKIEESLGNKIYISYSKYLNWRDLMPIEEPRRPEPRRPSVTCLWREQRSILALYGNKCKQCGMVQYPPQRICANCQAKDYAEDYELSDKKGHVFTYSVDYLTSSKDPPLIVATVDFEEGGRLMCEVADCETDKIRIGMPVQMCFRKLGKRGGIHNYLWKARPIF